MNRKTTAEFEQPEMKLGRRHFLLFLPTGIIGALITTAGAAAFRFLRPRKLVADAKWIDVAPLSELKGAKPITRKVVAEHVEGWARTFAEHHVYVLPANNNQVLSAICPHEGCEVAWESETNTFACPCHDSNFTADGARITGPARRGLDPLPSRVENGKLQVQYQFFANNTKERITRG